MSLITERAKKHYESRRELQGPIKVSEWGEGKDNDGEDRPLEIYFKIMNLAQQDKILNEIEGHTLKAMVQTIVTRSLDSEGKRLFRDIEKEELYKHADPKVIERVCRFMADDGEEEDQADEIKKD